jgi:chromosome segregation ATPase
MAENADINNRLIERQNEAKRAAEDSKTAMTIARNIFKEVEKIARDPELKDIAMEVSDMGGSEKLEAEIESAHARLEIVGGGQHKDTLRMFEDRKKKIEQLTAKIEEWTENLEGIASGIVEIRAKWEPGLDVLATKISDAFGHNMSQIGCAGQVSIYKADDEPDDEEDETSDFERWGIHIRVKFRETESLQLLTAHRQSGGERSVSTIFYLMALQSLSASPFRVVDEINQGMDPRNERKVHERMVDIACDRGGSQYFLITPKLLTGLKYKKGMNVHCIVSGEYVPQEATGGMLDFRRCVDLMRGYRREGQGLGGEGIMA